MTTFIVGSIVFLLFVLAGIKTFKNRKKGGCGCGCSSCSNSTKCHMNDNSIR